jgi:hypothetical protein
MTREELNAYYRQKRAVNPDAARAAERRYRERNPERVKEVQRKYREAHRAECRARVARARNSETKVEVATAYRKRWREDHPDREHASYQRRFADEGNRVGILLRNSIWQALKWQKAGKDWRSDAKIGAIVGCGRPALITHLESLFLPGMSWANYGRKGWHVDHIRPCCTFDLTQHDQVLVCFNFRNLRPLWASEHLRRSKKGNV